MFLLLAIIADAGSMFFTASPDAQAERIKRLGHSTSLAVKDKLGLRSTKLCRTLVFTTPLTTPLAPNLSHLPRLSSRKFLLVGLGPVGKRRGGLAPVLRNILLSILERGATETSIIVFHTLFVHAGQVARDAFW